MTRIAVEDLIGPLAGTLKYEPSASRSTISGLFLGRDVLKKTLSCGQGAADESEMRAEVDSSLLGPHIAVNSRAPEERRPRGLRSSAGKTGTLCCG